MMRELSLDHLKTLVAVLELGSFSAAARALHLAQPTVSLHVSELESRLSTPLVVRGGRRALPTAAGDLLVARARRLLRDAEETLELVKRHRDGQIGRVRLGSSSGATVHVLPELLETLESTHPGIDVHVTLGRSAELAAKLFVGDIDIALVAMPQPAYPGLRLTAWRTTPMLAMIPARWKAPKHVTPQWLASRPLIFNEPGTHAHQQVSAWFAAAGLHPTGRMTITYNEVARRLVAAGYGATILPLEHTSETLEGRLQALPLRPALQRQLGVAHRDPQLLDDATRRVLATVRAFGEIPRKISGRKRGGA